MGLMLTKEFWSYTAFSSLKHFLSEELDANTRFATSIAFSHFPVSQYAITVNAVPILEGRQRLRLNSLGPYKKNSHSTIVVALAFISK